MTTNKPEVVGFISEVGIKKLREDEYTGDWTLYAGPVRNSVTPLIRLSDYEALQGECEKLRAILSETAAAVGAHADPSCSLEFMSEVPKEVESVTGKLRKDAERYRWLREQCGSSGLLTIAKVGAFELNAWSGDDPDAAIDAAMQEENK